MNRAGSARCAFAPRAGQALCGRAPRGERSGTAKGNGLGTPPSFFPSFTNSTNEVRFREKVAVAGFAPRHSYSLPNANPARRAAPRAGRALRGRASRGEQTSFAKESAPLAAYSLPHTGLLYAPEMNRCTTFFWLGRQES